MSELAWRPGLYGAGGRRFWFCAVTLSKPGDLSVDLGVRLMLQCPGCEILHGIELDPWVQEPPPIRTWKFNGNYDAPTISPMIEFAGGGERLRPDGVGDPRCVFSLIDGRINFLLYRSEHALRGSFRDAPELPAWVLKVARGSR